MKYNLKPIAGGVQEKRKIDAHSRKIPILILRPEKPKGNAPGVLWLHGGGYFLGMNLKEDLSMELVKYNVVV